ncbi:protein FAM43A [Scleropages formosus]|uniref:Family with sequence similarity 43 member A n=1 Tax=Scleropages formosus TaxID=113540 RepID=A0A8C9U4V5_SCLFO|nr:protein FAM43A [Scleropages formosus]
MLPWKRSKFELIEEDQRAKQKGYSASLSYSALSSLARSCPESALWRVGSVFRSRRKKVQITGEDPTYTVLYLGNATTIQSKGDGCTDAAVSKIWSRSDMARSGTKMKLTVSAQGIRMVHADDKARRPGHLYLLHRITYCVADPRLPRVFAWIYRHELKHKAVMLRCHAVLASKPEKAKAMALLLYQTSAAALAEFKRLKRREDARHQQQQLVGEGTVPVAPLRKLLLLNGQCCYKPPVERSRSAPKLGSITEDLLGEEQEERAAHFEYEDLLGGGGVPEDAGQGLDRLIGDLAEMSIGNDVRALRADLGVTRLLSGESTSSESSADGPQEAPSTPEDGPVQEMG